MPISVGSMSRWMISVGGIENERTEAQICCVAGTLTPLDRCEAGDEFRCAERLRHIVVGTGIEGGDFHGFLIAHAQNEHGHVVLVGEGAVDIAAEPQLELYDMAALVPIVVEAGGRFTSLTGTDGPFGGNAVATTTLPP